MDNRVAKEVKKIDNARMLQPSIKIAEISDNAFDYTDQNHGYIKYLQEPGKNPFAIAISGISEENVRDFLFVGADTHGSRAIDSLAGKLRYNTGQVSGLFFKDTAIVENFINHLLSKIKRDQSKNLQDIVRFEYAPLKALKENSGRKNLNQSEDPFTLALFLLEKFSEKNATLIRLPESAARNLLLNEFNLILAQIKYVCENGRENDGKLAKNLAAEVRGDFQIALDAKNEYPKLVWDEQKKVVAKSGKMNFALTQPSRSPFESSLLPEDKKLELRKTVFAKWQHTALDAFEKRLEELKAKLTKAEATPGDLRVASVKFDGGTGQGKTFLINIITKYYGDQINISSVDLNSSEAKIAELRNKAASKSTAVTAKTEVVIIDEIYFQGESFLKSVGIEDVKDLREIEIRKEKFVRELASKGILVVLAGATENPEIYNIAQKRIKRKAVELYKTAQDAQDALYEAKKRADGGPSEKLLDLLQQLSSKADEKERLDILANKKEYLVELETSPTKLFLDSEDQDDEKLKQKIKAFTANTSNDKAAKELAEELLKHNSQQIDAKSIGLALDRAVKNAESAFRKAQQKAETAQNMIKKRDLLKRKIAEAAVTKTENIQEYKPIADLARNRSTLYILPDRSVKDFSEQDLNKISKENFIAVTPCFANAGMVNQKLRYKIWKKEDGKVTCKEVDEENVDDECLKIDAKQGLPRVILYDKTTAVGGDVGSLALDVDRVIVQCASKDKSIDDMVQFYGRYRGKTPSTLSVFTDLEKDAFVRLIENNTKQQDQYRIDAYLEAKHKKAEAAQDQGANQGELDSKLAAAKSEFELGVEQRGEKKRLQEENERKAIESRLKMLQEEQQRMQAELELQKITAGRKIEEARSSADKNNKWEEANRILQQERANFERAQEAIKQGLEAELAKLKQEQEARELEAQRLIREAKATKPQNALVDTIKKLQDEKAALEAKKRREDEERAAAEKAREQELRDKMAKLESELAELKTPKEATGKDNSLKDLEGQLKAAQEELVAQKAKLLADEERERERLEEERVKLEQAAQQEAERLQKEIDDARNRLLELKNKTADVDDGAAARAAAERAAIESEIERTIRANAEKAARKKQELDAQIADAKRRLQAAQDYKGTEAPELSEDELTNLQAELERAEKENKAATEAAAEAAAAAARRLAELRQADADAKAELSAQEAARAAATAEAAAALAAAADALAATEAAAAAARAEAEAETAAARAAAAEAAEKAADALRARDAELASQLQAQKAELAKLEQKAREEAEARSRDLEEKEKEIAEKKRRLQALKKEEEEEAKQHAAALEEAKQKLLNQAAAEKAAAERRAAAAAAAAAAIAALTPKTPAGGTTRPASAPGGTRLIPTTITPPRPASAGTEKKHAIDRGRLTEALAKGAKLQFSSAIGKDTIDRAHKDRVVEGSEAEIAENGRKNALFRSFVGALKKINSQLAKSTDAEKLLAEIWDKDSVGANPNALTTAQKSSLLIFCGALTIEDEKLANFARDVKDMNLNRKCAETPALKDLVLNSLRTIKQFHEGLVLEWIKDTNDDLKKTRNTKIPEDAPSNPAALNVMTGEVVKDVNLRNTSKMNIRTSPGATRH